MNEKYNVYLVSDSTGETLDRIFLSLKSPFSLIKTSIHLETDEDFREERGGSTL